MAGPRMDESWRAALADEFASERMGRLRDFLRAEKAAGKRIYPHSANWFRALELTALDDVRVVILGQDPYHGPGQAHGLAFSVLPGVPVPPSLLNIYKELHSDAGVAPARHGFLEPWAAQGVLLLNSVLTVEAGRAASHAGQGWEGFTDAIVARLNAEPRRIVFLLWGAQAAKKGAIVDTGRHAVLKAAHPSPLSAHNGFFGCRHFSRANALLAESGASPIDWALPPL
ncbi:uracil-DNA glycosylase [Sandaracinobacteroides saxicola]|uniref:Uracil-DNA glycosylase n=1 Tax=Sandaracinobacteroides saxicola TaxID=2759707 RepID=A0A7G5IJB6_9SPHN|nr:uracil-DNA glycosylase [Sandaracinobacteroides saxicola]QMW23458.1 uracil-DNA glycosylase [Sandaracinobacteroides saxicola]